jgi:hypothetical protein
MSGLPLQGMQIDPGVLSAFAAAAAAQQQAARVCAFVLTRLAWL